MALKSPLASQSFEITYESPGNDRGVDVIETSDSGYLLTGVISHPTQNENILLLKTNKDGKELWRKSIGGMGSDNGWSVLELSDGYGVFGFTDSFGSGGFDAFLLKTNFQGDSLWMKTYGNESDQLGWSIRTTSNAGFIALAQTNESNQLPNIWLLGLDHAGDVVWENSLGTKGTSNRAFYIDPDHNGNFVITGLAAKKEKSDDDVYIAKINARGELLWERILDYGSLELGHTVIANKNKYYVFGYTYLKELKQFKPLLVCLSKRGDEKWKQVLESIDGDTRIMHGQVLSDGFLLTGYQRTTNSNHLDVILAKVNSKGVPIWVKNYGGEWNDNGYTVRKIDNNKLILIGTKMADAKNADILLVYDSIR